MSLESALRDVVGERHVLVDPDVTASYGIDWTGRFGGPVAAVARPGTTSEVAGVLAAAAAHGLPVVPQGGNTGLVGGSVPRASAPAVVLSTRRLTRLDDVDTVARQVTAGAGVTLAALQAHARAAGLEYGVDLAARDSATVGGTVATNAGGVRVVANGATRAQVLGVEAVLADGSVVEHLGGLVKDNTGYDLAGLLCGSEGTLGVVTAARLRLLARRPSGPVLLIGLPSVAAALQLLPARGVVAAELLLDAGMALVERVAGLPQPLPSRWPAYLLLELTDDAPDPDVADDVEVAVDARRWEYRERHTEAIATLGVVHKLDVGLPLGAVAGFCDAALALSARHPGWSTYLFGHVGDGNVHVNVAGPAAEDESVDDEILRLAVSFGGSVSAEHGIGAAKTRWLSLSRTPAEIAAMRAIKRALDPGALLNPGVLFR